MNSPSRNPLELNDYGMNNFKRFREIEHKSHGILLRMLILESIFSRGFREGELIHLMHAIENFRINEFDDLIPTGCRQSRGTGRLKWIEWSTCIKWIIWIEWMRFFFLLWMMFTNQWSSRRSFATALAWLWHHEKSPNDKSPNEYSHKQKVWASPYE